MRRLLSSAKYKLFAMFGGVRMMPLVYLLLAACLAAAAAIMTAKTPAKVELAVLDECGGRYSGELVESLEASDSLDVLVCSDAQAGEAALLNGRAEVLLRISGEYDELILTDAVKPLITLETAPGAVSAELIRETVAGIMISNRSAAVVSQELEAEGYDTSRLSEYMREFEIPQMYRIETVGGGNAERAVFGSGYACYEGLCAFAMLLLMLTLSRRLADGSTRLVTFRMGAAKKGRALAFSGDVIALFAAGIIVAVIAFALAPEKRAGFALGLVCYDVCITGLCLLLARFSAAGRIDIAAPFIALVTSLIGGCFMDIASLSPALLTLARCTPQGQLIACAEGSLLFAPLLAAEGVLLALLSLAAGSKKGY